MAGLAFSVPEGEAVDKTPRSCPQSYPQIFGRLPRRKRYLLMTTLLIVYHTQSGTSARYAAAAVRGARREAGIETRVLRACDAGAGALAECDGLLLVAAENSGSLAGGMKDFLDRTFYPAAETGVVCPYALLISAGNDGRGAVTQARRILSGYPLVEALEPLILRGAESPGALSQCEELGEGLASGLQMGIF